MEGSQWWQTHHVPLRERERERERDGRKRQGGGRDRRFHCYRSESVEDSNKHWISGCLAAGAQCCEERNLMVRMQHHDCMHIKWIVHPKINILASPSCCSKPAWLCFFRGTQKRVFWKMSKLLFYIQYVNIQWVGRGCQAPKWIKNAINSQYDLSTAFVSLLIVLCEGPFNILAFISHSCFCAFKHFSKAQSYGKNHKVHESLQQA